MIWYNEEEGGKTDDYADSKRQNKRSDLYIYNADVWVVHNCTIFLCSLDLGNIVPRGDPLNVSVKFVAKNDHLPE